MSVHTFSGLFPRPAGVSFAMIVLMVLVFTSCNPRPTLRECKQALRNRIQLLNKNNREARENALREVDRLAQLCASGMKRESVMCDIKAKTVPELNQCR